MLMLPFLFIGFQEVTIILLVVVVVFGPKKIPEIARGLGEGIRAMRNATEDIKREILDAADTDKTAKKLKETEREINQEIQEVKKGIDETVGSVKRDF